MTVSTLNSIAEFDTNGVTTNFPFFFKFLVNEDLVVTYVSPLGVSTPLILGTNYTVNGAGSDVGGSIVTSAALPGPGQLVVARVMDAFQQTSLRNQGKFLAETHEDVFDRLTMLIQQNNSNFSRALSRPFGRDYFYGEGRRITDVADPIDNQDAANRQFVAAYVANILATGQGPINNAFNVIYSDGNSVGQIIRDKLVTVVNSIVALRAVLKTQYTHVFVSGYEPGTAGGGMYEYDSADTTSADNGGTIIVAADGGRWKLKFQKFVTVEQFGVLPIAGRNNFTRLQNAVAVCVAAKIELCGGSGVFECGSTLDMSYPTLVFRGNGFRNTVFKFTGSGRAMDAIGTRPNNGIYSFDLDLSDFTIEGNPATTDLLRCRINHARIVRINTREASTTAGCGFRFGGTVAGHYEQLTMSTNTQLMTSRPANGIIIEADPTLSGARATCNTLLSVCIEGATGDGVVFNACDQALVLGGASENCGGNGLTETAGCQMNSYLGFDCEHNLGFADIFIAGQDSNLTNCGSTRYTYIDNSARNIKMTGGWYDKVEVGVGAVGVEIAGIKTRFFGGPVGLVTNNNPFLSTNKIFDATANTYVAYGKPATGVALTASPMTYTNTNITEDTILIVGGTVTQIAYIRLGIPYLLNPASGCIRLQPGDGITINYTGSPVITRIPGGSNNQ
ncbi:hypothetical protein [Pseudomonas sp. GL-R-26]|uniref:hypothetical protein n=1 Tax=Pseudomonas sp. GL-R-26 TaxID=2832392 RepID=UPI001CBFD018|nr:hypothetical protein [Pseudomonas sp. GL-R-26]